MSRPRESAGLSKLVMTARGQNSKSEMSRKYFTRKDGIVCTVLTGRCDEMREQDAVSLVDVAKERTEGSIFLRVVKHDYGTLNSHCSTAMAFSGCVQASS